MEMIQNCYERALQLPLMSVEGVLGRFFVELMPPLLFVPLVRYASFYYTSGILCHQGLDYSTSVEYCLHSCSCGDDLKKTLCEDA